jgi:hypothetical protein
MPASRALLAGLIKQLPEEIIIGPARQYGQVAIHPNYFYCELERKEHYYGEEAVSH